MCLPPPWPVLPTCYLQVPTVTHSKTGAVCSLFGWPEERARPSYPNKLHEPSVPLPVTFRDEQSCMKLSTREEQLGHQTGFTVLNTVPCRCRSATYAARGLRWLSYPSTDAVILKLSRKHNINTRHVFELRK